MASPKPITSPKPTPAPTPAPKPQPNVVPQSSRPTLTPPTPTKTPTTPTKTPTKTTGTTGTKGAGATVEFTGPSKYSPIDPKVQAALDKAAASKKIADEKIAIAKAKSEEAKKKADEAKAKIDLAKKKKAEADAKDKGNEDDDTGTGNDFAGKFITTKSVKVGGGTNIFNVFSNGKGGTYEEFVAFIPDDEGGDDTESNLRAAELLTEEKRDRQRTALEEFVSILSGAGLKDLADEVNKMILDDKTAAQIKLEIRKTKSYEARFPGMKALSDAQRAITEGEYIDLETGMISVLRSRGLDAEVYGSRSELGKYIGNFVKLPEFEERAALAADRVKKEPDVMKALGEMYVTEADAIGYLLNPLKAMDVIKKQVRSAEIGAAAASARFMLGADAAARAREAEALIGATGTADVSMLKQEFGKARILADTQSSLAKLERENYNELEAVQAVVGGEQEKLLKSKRRAERESMFRFGGQSGVGAYSLRSTTNQ